MANIKGQALFEAKQSMWSGFNGTRFPLDYIIAVNNTLAEYAILMDTGSALSVDDPQDDIPVDSTREFCISHGIDMWLARIGNFRSGEITWASAREDFLEAVSKCQTLRDRDTARAALDADGTTHSYESMGLL